MAQGYDYLKKADPFVFFNDIKKTLGYFFPIHPIKKQLTLQLRNISLTIP